MRNQESKKEVITMPIKKTITLLTAVLLLMLPIQGVAISAANAVGVETALQTFTIDGSDVEDGDTFIVDSNTTSVAVVALASDSGARVAISGGTSLITGDNAVLVVVTASGGISNQSYRVNVFRSAKASQYSSDASVREIKINNVSVTTGQTFEVPALTLSVVVTTITSSTFASSVVTGSRDLKTGLNDLFVTVTAEDGSTKRQYAFKVRVLPLASDVALAGLSVNGVSVRSGDRVFLPLGTESVSVVATPSDNTSSVVVTGRTGLKAGANSLVILVTAASGAAKTYTVELNVQSAASDSSLAVFKVSDVKVQNGSKVFLPSGTKTVSVTAIPSDNAASVAVTGGVELVLGENTLRVVVTAEDGTSTTSRVTLNVLADSDTSLKLLQFDGKDIASGDVFELVSGTESVDVVAEATSEFSAVEVFGADVLVAGRNVVRVVVTAEDGSFSSSLLTFNVAFSNDVTLESLTVNGQDATAGVSVPAGTRAVTVAVVTTDPYATYAVDGFSELEAGTNTVTVTVTAQDGQNSKDYLVEVTVASTNVGDDSTLEILQINGNDIEDGGEVDLRFGTKFVNYFVQSTDSLATVSIVGDGRIKPLVLGSNSFVVTVTAANGTATSKYRVVLRVNPASNVKTISPEDGLLVNGEAIDLAVLDNVSGFVNLPTNATTVDILAFPEDMNAKVKIEDRAVVKTALRFSVSKGINLFTLKVTPESGAQPKDYILRVYVGGADATLKTVKVNSTSITIAEDLSGRLATALTSGTKIATLLVEPTIAQGLLAGNGTKIDVELGEGTATKALAANTWNLAGLVAGENEVTVTVTPGDRTLDSVSYTIVIPIAYSSEKGLKTFLVNGVSRVIGDKFVLPKGTTSVQISGVPVDAGASVEVDGGEGLVNGLNTISVTVTAEDESSKTYTVIAVVPNQVSSFVIIFPKKGIFSVDKKTNPKGNAGLLAVIKKLKGTAVIVTITNNYVMKGDKVAAGPQRAKNTQGFLMKLTTNSFKTATYQLIPDPKIKTAKGTTVTMYAY